MIDTAKLYSLLENATTIDEEVFDLRFEEVISLVDEERLHEASKLITAILNEGRVDLRLVMYHFYAQFINQGIGSLTTIFPAIQTILDDHWEKISPVNMRDKYLLSSLTWFLSSVGKKLKRSEKLYKSKKADEFWNKSVHGLTAQKIEQLLADTKTFAAYLHKKTDDTDLNQYLLFISKWMENLKGVAENGSADEPEESRSDEPAPQAAVKASTRPQMPLKEVIDASEPFMLLFKKIQAFEALIAKQQFEKAALVSEDLSLILKNFDPSVYFPKLFSKYFALSAVHIDTLAQEWENKNALKWEALQRLYQTDLEEFIEW
ncbi:MAG TPA: type VI secretion system protein IglI family protein [Rhabdochlamydiaceae bacterium]